MEAGAHFHEDPERMTSRPAAHAVRDANDGVRVSGWVVFSGVYLMIAGLLNVVWGVTALSKTDYFTHGGLVWSNLTTWGWIAIVVAAAQVIAGVLLLAHRSVGLSLGMGIAVIALLVNFLTLGAYPAWSAVALVCNGLVLWALSVHGEALLD